MLDSINFINNLNIKDKVIVVGVSGGPDSMCLLDILIKNGYKVVCAHVHHNLRKESDQEYKFVQDYCKKNKIIFEGMKIDKYKNNKFTEQEAREKRYEFFFGLLKKYNTDILATAHHGDDLIETILMRIIRGSNLKGYKGFSKVSYNKDYKIIRPLIFYTKDEIENYVISNNISFVIDKTNESKKYTRNRIRLDILPLLRKENENINKKFLLFNEEMEKVNTYLEKIVKNEMLNNYSNNTLNLDKFNLLDIYIKEKELEKILLSLYNNNISLISKNHINNILKLIDNNNKYIVLPNNLFVIKEYNYLYFKFDYSINKIEYKYLLKDSVIIDNYGEIKFISDEDDNSNYIIRLNSSNIKLPLYIRNVYKDDVIHIKNMKGHKYIKKIFIDEKVSKDKRYNYPVLIDSNNNILWVPGLKKSNFDCSKTNNYDIIIKYIKKGE